MLAAYCRSFLRAHGGNNSTAVDDCDSQGESHSAGSTPGEGGGGYFGVKSIETTFGNPRKLP